MLTDLLKLQKFKKELEQLLNKYSIDNDVDTPDYILASYIYGCLREYAAMKKQLDLWRNSENETTTKFNR